MDGFSFASVVLSYFLIGGGLFAGMLVGSVFEVQSDIVAYALIGAGGFAGGFVAARASRGSTIVEPAIGAVLVVGTVVTLAATTEMGKAMWGMAHDETIKLVGGVGMTSMLGAIIGAFISERVFGEATTSSFPWIVYTAMSTFGACLLASLVVGTVVKSDSGTAVGLAAVLAVAGGCLLAGLAVGASARTRPLVAAFLGGGIGVAGFFYLTVRMTVEHDRTNDMIAGLALLGAGGAVFTLIGGAIGWAMFGRSG